jgi:hypothetical protein
MVGAALFEGGSMYSMYEKKACNGYWEYSSPDEIHLFGCVQGLIPRFLQHITPADASEPYLWHLNVAERLAASDLKDMCVVIDIKPKNKTPVVHLSELLDVWGYSADSWTPLLFRLRPLLVEEDPVLHNRNNFLIDEEDSYEPVYSILYVHGSVMGGELVGKWTPPGASSTNSALLWPHVLRYFLQCISKNNPEYMPRNDKQM